MPNLKFTEPLPPNSSPVFMAKPAQPRPAGQTAQATAPAPARVAQQQQAPRQPREWRAPAPAYYGPPRGFFGLFR